MSAHLKATLSATLAVLALSLIIGAAVISSHVTLGIFLTTAALMLSPFAGVVMLACGVIGKRGLVNRSLYSLSGMLILASLAVLIVLPKAQATAALVIFIAGTAVGIVAVQTQATRRA